MKEVVRNLTRDKKFDADLHVHFLEISDVLQGVQKANIKQVDQSIKMSWYHTISEMEFDGPIILIANEYFDALPIYRFHYRDPSVGWCEELVDFVDDKFRFVLSNGPTPPTFVCLGEDPPKQLGSVEVSPDSQSIMKILCQKMSKQNQHASAALIVDYGKFGPSENSLRAIQRHKFVDIFENLGNCDLSVDVDFRMLSNVVKMEQMYPSDCITQNEFLEKMGIDLLALQMLKRAKDEKETKSIISEFNRVMEDMGNVYKVICVSNKESVLKRLL